MMCGYNQRLKQDEPETCPRDRQRSAQIARGRDEQRKGQRAAPRGNEKNGHDPIVADAVFLGRVVQCQKPGRDQNKRNPHDGEFRRLGGFENHVGILSRIACADQSDRVGHTFFKRDMGFEIHVDISQRRHEALFGRSRVVFEELLGHGCVTDDEVGPDGEKHVQHGRYIIDKREVHGFEHGPEGKAAVCDYERVGVTDTAEQAEKGWIQNSGLKHNRVPFFRIIQKTTGQRNGCVWFC